MSQPLAASARRARKFPVPTSAQRHLLSRFSYGVTPALVRDMRQAGGTDAWFRRQLNPSRIDDRSANQMREWFPVLDRSPLQLWRMNVSGQREGWEIMADFVRWSMLRRTYSHRQVHEVMTEFWSNLLHIPAPGDGSWPHRISYDATIRKHALGRYDQLLHAAITHPAMGCYLDNAKSTKYAPNENLGREVLELHTVGRNYGEYTEKDVYDSALILTGYWVDKFETWEATYRPDIHHVGPVSVMGFSDPNDSGDGRDLVRRYLRYLAHHPATARRIAERLALRFVSDTPTAELITDLKRTYLRSGTDISATLRTLVGHPEFKRSAGAKVRTPSEDLVATLRVLGHRALEPSRDSDLGFAIIWQADGMGEQPFHWPTPDGPPLVNDAWTSVSRMLGSWKAHLNVAAGIVPKTGLRMRRPNDWMPDLPARFEDVVDHVCRQLLARPASDALLDTACLAVDIPRRERITRDHRLLRWQLPWLLQSLLDTPQHMTR